MEKNSHFNTGLQQHWFNLFPRTRLHLLQHANNVEARSGSSFSSGWSNKLAIVNTKQLPWFEVDVAFSLTFWTFTFIVLCVKINKRETFPCLWCWLPLPTMSAGPEADGLWHGRSRFISTVKLLQFYDPIYCFDFISTIHQQLEQVVPGCKHSAQKTKRNYSIMSVRRARSQADETHWLVMFEKFLAKKNLPIEQLDKWGY